MVASAKRRMCYKARPDPPSSCVLTKSWILRPPRHLVPLRLVQGLALTIWPLSWQYQVFHLCRIRQKRPQPRGGLPHSCFPRGGEKP